MKTNTEMLANVATFVADLAAGYNAALAQHRALEIPNGPRLFVDNTEPGRNAIKISGYCDLLLDLLLAEGSITGEQFDALYDQWLDLTQREQGA